MTPPPFDPLAILRILETSRVAYVVIGKLAAVIHGSGGTTNGIDICPQLKDSNLQRLQAAIDELDARGPRNARIAIDEDRLGEQPVLKLRTSLGELGIVANPAGTRNGYDDLRRRAVREPLGKGVRAPVAAIEDLVRIAAALEDPANRDELMTLRRIAELEKSRGVSR
jgi:hypothetical protein